MSRMSHFGFSTFGCSLSTPVRLVGYGVGNGYRRSGSGGSLGNKSCFGTVVGFDPDGTLVPANAVLWNNISLGAGTYEMPSPKGRTDPLRRSNHDTFCCVTVSCRPPRSFRSSNVTHCGRQDRVKWFARFLRLILAQSEIRWLDPRGAWCWEHGTGNSQTGSNLVKKISLFDLCGSLRDKISPVVSSSTFAPITEGRNRKTSLRWPD